MTDRLPRSVIEPVNPKLNVSRNANLPHSPGIRVGDYIFLSGMGPVDPVTSGRNLGTIAEQIRQTAAQHGAYARIRGVRSRPHRQDDRRAGQCRRLRRDEPGLGRVLPDRSTGAHHLRFAAQ